MPTMMENIVMRKCNVTYKDAKGVVILARNNLGGEATESRMLWSKELEEECKRIVHVRHPPQTSPPPAATSNNRCDFLMKETALLHTSTTTSTETTHSTSPIPRSTRDRHAPPSRRSSNPTPHQQKHSPPSPNTSAPSSPMTRLHCLVVSSKSDRNLDPKRPLKSQQTGGSYRQQQPQFFSSPVQKKKSLRLDNILTKAVEPTGTRSLSSSKVVLAPTIREKSRAPQPAATVTGRSSTASGNTPILFSSNDDDDDDENSNNDNSRNVDASPQAKRLGVDSQQFCKPLQSPRSNKACKTPERTRARHNQQPKCLTTGGIQKPTMSTRLHSISPSKLRSLHDSPEKNDPSDALERKAKSMHARASSLCKENSDWTRSIAVTPSLDRSCHSRRQSRSLHPRSKSPSKSQDVSENLPAIQKRGFKSPDARISPLKPRQLGVDSNILQSMHSPLSTLSKSHDIHGTPERSRTKHKHKCSTTGRIKKPTVPMLRSISSCKLRSLHDSLEENAIVSPLERKNISLHARASSSCKENSDFMQSIAGTPSLDRSGHSRKHSRSARPRSKSPSKRQDAFSPSTPKRQEDDSRMRKLEHSPAPSPSKSQNIYATPERTRTRHTHKCSTTGRIKKPAIPMLPSISPSKLRSLHDSHGDGLVVVNHPERQTVSPHNNATVVMRKAARTPLRVRAKVIPSIEDGNVLNFADFDGLSLPQPLEPALYASMQKNTDVLTDATALTRTSHIEETNRTGRFNPISDYSGHKIANLNTPVTLGIEPRRLPGFRNKDEASSNSSDGSRVNRTKMIPVIKQTRIPENDNDSKIEPHSYKPLKDSGLSLHPGKHLSTFSYGSHPPFDRLFGQSKNDNNATLRTHGRSSLPTRDKFTPRCESNFVRNCNGDENTQQRTTVRQRVGDNFPLMTMESTPTVATDTNTFWSDSPFRDLETNGSSSHQRRLHRHSHGKSAAASQAERHS